MIRFAYVFAVVFATPLAAFAQAGDASHLPPEPRPMGPTATPAPGALAPTPLSESLIGQSATDYHAGRILFDDQDYAGAAIKFERAYHESSDPRLLWNVATCEKNQRHYAAVSDLLQRYLAEAGAGMTPEHRTEVADVLRTVRMLISTVQIATEPSGVSIFIDDKPAGTTPLPGPLTVDLGRREFRLAKPGFKPQRFAQDVAGASEVSFNITMQREETDGQLRVIAGEGQHIRIDGRIVGQGQWTGTLPAGDHSLRVTADGMRPYDKDVAIVAGQMRSLYVALETEARGVPAWVWIGAGALVAGGLATSGYFLFRGPRELGPEQASLDEVPL